VANFPLRDASRLSLVRLAMTQDQNSPAGFRGLHILALESRRAREMLAPQRLLGRGSRLSYEVITLIIFE